MHQVNRRLSQILMLASLTVLFAVPASASIIGGTVTGGSAQTAGGAFVLLAVPFIQSTPVNTVGNDTFQSPNLYGFNEDQNVQVTGPLVVDVGSSPIPVGTIVASHYIFFDPVSASIVGTVDFDSDILAIITSTNNLFDSDYLANTGVTYLNPSARGLEVGDSVTISGLRQIRFDTTAGTPGDYVRVLTAFSPGAAVPEPGAGLLFVGGVGLIWMLRRRAA
jgi:hypothetical protein